MYKHLWTQFEREFWSDAVILALGRWKCHVILKTYDLRFSPVVVRGSMEVPCKQTISSNNIWNAHNFLYQHSWTQYTMAQALKKIGIKDLAKIMTLAPIFSSQNYFRWKYLDVTSFPVSLSIHIWVRVENSHLQQ